MSTLNSALQASQQHTKVSVRRATRLIRGDRQLGQNRTWYPTRSGAVRLRLSWVIPCGSLVDRRRRGIGRHCSTSDISESTQKLEVPGMCGFQRSSLIRSAYCNT